jgi:hypothetical protein
MALYEKKQENQRNRLSAKTGRRFYSMLLFEKNNVYLFMIGFIHPLQTITAQSGNRQIHPLVPDGDWH